MIQIKWKPCFADPYVKVWLMFGEKRVEKKKTPVYKCNLNPTFNQVTWITKITYGHIFFIKFSFLDVWVWCALGANSWLCPWHRGKFRYLSGFSSKHHQHHQWWFTILLDFILNNISGIHIRILFVFKKRGQYHHHHHHDDHHDKTGDGLWHHWKKRNDWPSDVGL